MINCSRTSREKKNFSLVFFDNASDKVCKFGRELEKDQKLVGDTIGGSVESWLLVVPSCEKT